MDKHVQDSTVEDRVDPVAQEGECWQQGILWTKSIEVGDNEEINKYLNTAMISKLGMPRTQMADIFWASNVSSHSKLGC